MLLMRSSVHQLMEEFVAILRCQTTEVFVINSDERSEVVRIDPVEKLRVGAKSSLEKVLEMIRDEAKSVKHEEGKLFVDEFHLSRGGDVFATKDLNAFIRIMQIMMAEVAQESRNAVDLLRLIRVRLIEFVPFFLREFVHRVVGWLQFFTFAPVG